MNLRSCQKRSAQGRRGFVLLESILALALFAMIAVGFTTAI
jgi:prepilin-type N-terminal cleavage/methylation domain-containing protein